MTIDPRGSRPKAHAFNPTCFRLTYPDEEGRPVRTFPLRPLWAIRLAVRSMKMASWRTGGDGCREGDWSVASHLEVPADG